MKKDIGLWIDRRKTVMVVVNGKEHEIKVLKSGLEGRVRYHGASGARSYYGPQYGQGDDQIDKKFNKEANEYYDEVIAELRNADQVLIFGPGEAKDELQNRIEQEKAQVPVVAVEPADKMTDRQIAAKVRKFFEKA